MIDYRYKHMLKKNDEITLEITDLTNLGMGVAHVDGVTVFVKGGVTGDVVRAKIIKAASSYLVAMILSFDKESEYRTQSECTVSKRCGGCSFRHIKYEYELEIKRRYVESCMKKSGLPYIIVNPVLTTGQNQEYRNKIQYPVGDKGIGYFASRTHDIIVSDKPCMLHMPIFDPILDVIQGFIKEFNIQAYNEETGKGILRHVFLRATSPDNENNQKVCVCIVVNADKLSHSEELVKRLSMNKSVSGILLNHNSERTNVILGKKYTLLWGSEYLRDSLCGLSFDISPSSFYQVNHDGAELLYKTALDMADIRQGDTLVDLFCGTGTIGLIFKKYTNAERLIGVEIVPQAVENAKKNAIINGIENTEFYCGDANEPHINNADVVIVDPPRKGLDEKLIDRISQISPRQVVYISCDCATLARDMKLFEEKGYKAESVTPVDMFPGTGHIECVVLLSKDNRQV